MVYVVYWKKASEEVYHKISSDSPITWNQLIETLSEPNPLEGGDFTNRGGLTVSAYSLNNNRQVTYDVVSYRFGWEYSTGSAVYPNGRPWYGYYSLFAVLCTGQDTTISSIREIIYYEDGRIYRDTNLMYTFSATNYGACNPNIPPPTSSTVCKTTFSTGLVITEEECIDVRTEPPGCECCAVLMPKATKILGML